MSDAVIMLWSVLAFALIIFLILAIWFPDVIHHLQEFWVGPEGAGLKCYDRAVETKEHRTPSRGESKQLRAVETQEHRKSSRGILRKQPNQVPPRDRILWVDDKPLGNLYEVMALKEVGWDVIGATTNARAAEALKGDRFALVISDIDRDPACEPKNAGRELPEALAAVSNYVPPIIYYVGTVTEPLVHGKYPVTNRPSELFRLIADRIRQPAPDRA